MAKFTTLILNILGCFLFVSLKYVNHDAEKQINIQNFGLLKIFLLNNRHEKAGSYECRCAKECKSLNFNFIKSPIVRTVAPSIYRKKKVNGTLILESAGVPIAKQGGSACYPSACMNGGTCFSSYNPVVGTTTTTTTTASPLQPAICVKYFFFN